MRILISILTLALLCESASSYENNLESLRKQIDSMISLYEKAETEEDKETLLVSFNSPRVVYMWLQNKRMSTLLESFKDEKVERTLKRLRMSREMIPVRVASFHARRYTFLRLANVP